MTVNKNISSAVTWAANTNNYYSDLFESLRNQQYNDKSHRYWKNYELSQFKDVVAYTIYFNAEGEPEVCSSISQRACWPQKTYRILNRTWKRLNKKKMMPEISQAVGSTTISQIQWLSDNVDHDLYFISRQSNHWMDWTVKNFKRQFNLDFKITEHKYLTCHKESDPTCWQNIIFNGDEKLLENWQRI